MNAAYDIKRNARHGYLKTTVNYHTSWKKMKLHLTFMKSKKGPFKSTLIHLSSEVCPLCFCEENHMLVS